MHIGTGRDRCGWRPRHRCGVWTWGSRTVGRRYDGGKAHGLDIAEAALAHARRLADRLSVEAEFEIGSFESTGQADGVADVVMSVDAFLFTPDKRAGFVELGRVLRPGGRLAMTSWDYSSQPRNRPPQVPNHRPLAEDAGLRVLVYEETHDWYQRCSSFADYLLEHAEEAAAEVEQPVEELREALQEMRDSMEQMTRRFLMIAEKPLA